MSHLLSECCSAPPLNNTDVHDGIAMCNQCKEWSGFYDEDKENERKANEWREPINFSEEKKDGKYT